VPGLSGKNIFFEYKLKFIRKGPKFVSSGQGIPYLSLVTDSAPTPETRRNQLLLSVVLPPVRLKRPATRAVFLGRAAAGNAFFSGARLFGEKTQ
jgi:hypothetical protein